MSSHSAAASILATWLLLATTHSAGADPTGVYRCQQAGQVIYQSEPCSQGTKLDLDDRRTEQQRREALESVTRDAATADKLATWNTKRLQQASIENRLMGRQGVVRGPQGMPLRAQPISEKAPSRRARQKTFKVRTAAPTTQASAPSSPSTKKKAR